MKTKLIFSLFVLLNCLVLPMSGQSPPDIIGRTKDNGAVIINPERASLALKAKLPAGATVTNLRIHWLQTEGKYFLMAKVDHGIQSAIGIELGFDGEDLYALARPIELNCQSSHRCNECDWEMVNFTTLICKCSSEGKCEITKSLPFQP